MMRGAKSRTDLPGHAASVADGSRAEPSVVVQDPDPQEWDRFVDGATGGSIFQSAAWGEARRVQGWIPWRLAVRDARGWAAAALCGIRRVGPVAVLHVQRGPVFRTGAEGALHTLLHALEQRARRERALFIKLTPDVQCDDRCVEAFSARSYYPVPGDAYAHRATYRVDLSGGEHAVLARFEGRTRRALQRAERDAVMVQSGFDTSLRARFSEMATRTAERRGFCAPDPRFLHELASRFGAAGSLRVFIAQRNERDAAGAVVLRFGSRGTYLWGGSVQDPELRRSNPAEAVQWAAIRWSIESGCREYDLHGVPVDGDGQPVGGLSLFKRGFGGRLVHLVGDLDRAIDPAGYRLWRCVEPLYLRGKGVRA